MDAAANAITIEVENWGLIDYLIQMLLPFENLTLEGSKEDCTMRQTMPLMHMLQEHLQKVEQTLIHANEDAAAWSTA